MDLGKFSLDNIEEVSLYNSQNPDIFQSAKNFGNASSIYIKSRRPAFKDSQFHYIRAALKTGSFGLINPSVYWQQKIADNIATTINAELINAHGRYKTRYKKWAYDTTVVRQNADVASQRVELAIQDINKDTATHWKIQGYFYNSESEACPGPLLQNVSITLKGYGIRTSLHKVLSNIGFRSATGCYSSLNMQTILHATWTLP
ncbi:hypothetical protein [Niabella hibiscisoli]|uniref:hypothetical protein n=1 Tax=Niabella hibiscisoli TaxID=1825928 RepID=UPI001F10269C|nr:hypothetical protein [Niabella hibiscisoli]MCH5716059.1 hypothetical protein [Niabella hibiscisoli]